MGVSMSYFPANLDDRGVLWQIYEDGDPIKVKRIYVIRNWKKGIIRGFHEHKKEWKAYFVVQGAAKFVFKDKEGIHSEILSDKDARIIKIGPNTPHGWMSLTDDTILIGMSDKTLEESEKDDIRTDPFKFGDVWSVKGR